MLRKFVEAKYYKFADEAADWREAIRMSCEALEAGGVVEANYKEEIIACIEKYGPYIVIMPGVAMPHSQEYAKGVHKTEIAFMKLEKPVSFEPGSPDMDVSLFFTLASCNPDCHLKNMMKLSELLMNEGVMEALHQAKSPEDLLSIQEHLLGG